MAEVITSGKVIQKPEVVLEVDDFLPPGVVGVRNKTRDEAGSFDIGVGDESTGTLIEDGTDTDGPGSPADGLEGYEELPIPTEMTIVSQTTRVGPDGKILVDVIIETPDFPGINEFEARLTRDAPN